MVTVTDLVFSTSKSELISDRDETAMNELLRKVCSTPYLLWDGKGQEITAVSVLSHLQGAVSLYQFPLWCSNSDSIQVGEPAVLFPINCCNLEGSDDTSPKSRSDM